MSQIRLQVCDAASKSLFDGGDSREAAVQHEFGSRFNFLRRPLPPVAIGHREREGRIRDVVDLISQIGSVACGCLAALFGSDARDDDTVNAMLRKPDGKSAADQSAVAALLEDSIRRERHILQWHNVTRLQREWAGILDVKNLDDWDFARLNSANQRLEALNERRYVGVAPVRTITERFLHVNDKKRSCRSGH